MNLSIQPYKGARDFYPEDKRIQKYIFEKIRSVAESFGYQEYDAPILEPFDIYAAKSGDELVNEQIYGFEDRGGRKVAIRPEMTPSVSRMVAGRRQELAYPLRLYSIPNLWRYERPQRGRLREHYQLNVDLFGIEGLEGDAEIIQVADAVLKSFGAKSGDYEIRLNSRAHLNQQFESLGLSEDQKHICLKHMDKQSKIDPVEFEKLFIEKLGEDKARALLSFLRSKNVPQAVKELLSLLSSSGVKNAVYDPGVVRGLDYYTDVIFEVFDTDPENNRSMFGGGRYDGLVGLFGVEPLPTVGFGMGDVTLRNFLETHKLLPQLAPETDAVAILIGDIYLKAQPALAKLRAGGLKISVDSSGRKLDAQIRSAVKSGVRHAIFIGEKELASNRFPLRDLRKGEEKALTLDQIINALNAPEAA